VSGRLLDVRDRFLDLWDHVATMPRRAFIYAALALAVPLPAYALSSGDAPESAPAALSVSVLLDRCGLLETEIVCKLDVSYGEIAGATSYTASVTRADGSVVDYGEVGGGDTSLWVPYVGAGTYSVEIAAYGDPPQPGGRPDLLSRDLSTAQGRTPGSPQPLERSVRPGYAEPDVAVGGGTGDRGAGGEPVHEPPAPECQEVEPPASEEPPLDSDGDGVPDDLEGVEARPGEAPPDAESADPTSAALGDVPEPTAAAPAAEASLPDSVDCPDE
jgi:hypothetical protein